MPTQEQTHVTAQQTEPGDPDHGDEVDIEEHAEHPGVHRDQGRECEDPGQHDDGPPAGAGDVATRRPDPRHATTVRESEGKRVEALTNWVRLQWGFGKGVGMTRHQALALLLTRRIPDDVGSIEATLRAITARLDAVVGDEEYDQAHHRLDELLTARERALPATRCSSDQRPASVSRVTTSSDALA